MIQRVIEIFKNSETRSGKVSHSRMWVEGDERLIEEIQNALLELRNETIEQCASLAEDIGKKYSSTGMLKEAQAVLLTSANIRSLK